MRAEGVKKIVVVTDEPDKYPAGFIPAGMPVYHRRDLQAVQKELRQIEGVSVLIYDQTCAAEKRRRRKRGTFPDPDKRVFINPAVCEGCGDCGVKSNCVAVAAAGDRARHQARDRPVGLQQGFLLRQRLLPELRHGARRQGAAQAKAATADASVAHAAGEPAGAEAAVAGQALHDAGHGRRRHGRRDDLGRARPGRATSKARASAPST